MKNTFSESEIKLLKALEGKTVRYVGGPSLPDYLVGPQIVVATTSSAVIFSGRVFAHQFTSGQLEFSCIDVEQASDAVLATVEASGGIYKHFTGQIIREVLFLEETNALLLQDEEVWSNTSLVSVLLVLDKTTLAVTKLSHHMEALVLKDIGAGDPRLEVPEVSMLFEESLIEKRVTSRRVLTSTDVSLEARTE